MCFVLIFMLNQAWNAASTEMYQAQQEATAASGDGAPGGEPTAEADEQEIKDVDFEIVDEDEEKP